MKSNTWETKAFALGPHRVEFMPPDLARVTWNGEATPEQMINLYDLGDQWMPAERFFVIADLSKLTGAQADTRKVAASDPRAKRVAAIAMIGAQFHMRVLMTMFIKATELFYPGKAAKMTFVATEEEALQWIETQRKKPQETT